MTPHEPSITNDLFLLLLTDEGKPESFGQQTGYGLAGALLGDLAEAGRLSVSDDGKKLQVLDPTPVGHPVLDEALRRFVEQDGKKLSSAVPAVAGHAHRLERLVGDHLAEQGVVRIEEGALLGLKPRRYPVVDPTREQQLRAGLGEVLRGAQPSAHQQTLLALVNALSSGPGVFDDQETGLSRRELKQRLKDVAAAGSPEAAGVSRAVAQVTAAISAAAIVPVITAGS